jgi:hypothetical protein
MNTPTNSTRENVSTTVDKSWQGAYKTGGVCLVLTGIFFILGFALTMAQGQSPSTIEETLTAIAGQKLLYQAANGAFILSDLFPISAMLALYLALKEGKRTHALMATAMGVLGATLAIGLRTWVHAMGALGSGFVAASSEAQRAAYVAATDLVTGATDPGLTLANVLLYGFTLIISIAMLAGVFGKKAAYLGIVTGALGIVGLIGAILVPALSMVTLLAAIGWAVWFFIVGFGLYKLGG